MTLRQPTLHMARSHHSTNIRINNHNHLSDYNTTTSNRNRHNSNNHNNPRPGTSHDKHPCHVPKTDLSPAAHHRPT